MPVEAGSWPTSAWGCAPPDPATAAGRRAGRGRPDRPGRRLAADPVRRRGPARLPGPGAGPRARPAAARRAVQRARRADPDQPCTAWCSGCGRTTSPPSCWSPTTSTRRIALADRVLVLDGGRIASAAGSTRPGPATATTPALVALRAPPAVRARRQPGRNDNDRANPGYSRTETAPLRRAGRPAVPCSPPSWRPPARQRITVELDGRRELRRHHQAGDRRRQRHAARRRPGRPGAEALLTAAGPDPQAAVQGRRGPTSPPGRRCCRPWGPARSTSAPSATRRRCSPPRAAARSRSSAR